MQVGARAHDGQGRGMSMTAEPHDHENQPPEPLIEERGDGASPTIAQAGDDIAELIVGDRGGHVDAGDDRPTTLAPGGSA